MTDSLTALADRLDLIAMSANPKPIVWGGVSPAEQIREVAAALRQHAGSGWVKTSERLPETATDVWIPCREGVMEASFVDNGFCYWDEDEREWIELDTPDWWTPRIVPTPPHTD